MVELAGVDSSMAVGVAAGVWHATEAIGPTPPPMIIAQTLPALLAAAFPIGMAVATLCAVDEGPRVRVCVCSRRSRGGVGFRSNSFPLQVRRRGVVEHEQSGNEASTTDGRRHGGWGDGCENDDGCGDLEDTARPTVRSQFRDRSFSERRVLKKRKGSDAGF